jgi:hypothetical protein
VRLLIYGLILTLLVPQFVFAIYNRFTVTLQILVAANFFINRKNDMAESYGRLNNFYVKLAVKKHVSLDMSLHCRKYRNI